MEEAFPTLQRWAFDIFACPATSCECERAFSSAKAEAGPAGLLGSPGYTCVTEMSYHIWSGDHTRTFYTPHR